jgi:hypothetical protein
LTVRASGQYHSERRFTRRSAFLGEEVTFMEGRILRAGLIVGVLLLTGACATSEEWAEWKRHSTHFASDKHLVFNPTDTSPPLVRRSQIEAARAENWWGKAVTVNPDQIFKD